VVALVLPAMQPVVLRGYLLVYVFAGQVVEGSSSLLVLSKTSIGEPSAHFIAVCCA
jgi:hypothetical protein